MEEGRLEDIARDALAAGQESEALRTLAPAAEVGESARLWQWTGLLQRALDQHEQALRSFRRATQLAPEDGGIAHGLARTALEAGLDATALFERARALGPSDGSVHLGLAAARFAIGQGARAVGELEQLLAQSPLWEEGHRQLGQLYSMLGQPELANRSIERALAAAPKEVRLWRILWNLNIRAADYEDLQRNISRAMTSGLSIDTNVYSAIASAELEQTAAADRLFAKAPPEVAEALRVWHVRHLIRSGRPDAAARLVDGGLNGPQSDELWPYASIVWRLTGDARSAWLQGEAAMVRAIDVSGAFSEVDALAAELRLIHRRAGRFLDQSVRGGTQTDGPLFSRIDPMIRKLRRAIVDAVQDYTASLPPPDNRHPLLGRRRDRPVRFSGSWSVRLNGGGHHSSHVHPQGWISSAFYAALPEVGADEPVQSGWLTIGEPPVDLRTSLPAMRAMEPRIGQLVLFPSWMWHGTLPFAAGERLTVAFDVRPPA